MYDRFDRIPGADQGALARAHAVLIGCGGIGGEVGVGLARKGVGQITLFDHDSVEPSNLARQQFGPEDVGRNKAMALAGNLRRHATGRTVLEGHARSFQSALEDGIDAKGDVAVVGVDNNVTRLEAAKYYHAHRIPSIFLAVDANASRGYVFLQTSRPAEACFACMFPDAGEDREVYGCAGASIEVLKVVAGIALYAVDSLLMARPRPWNYKDVFLDREGDGSRLVVARGGCPICGCKE